MILLTEKRQLWIEEKKHYWTSTVCVAKFHFSEKGTPNTQSVIPFKPTIGCLERNPILMNNLRVLLFSIFGDWKWFTSVKGKKRSKWETFAPQGADKIMVKKVWVIGKPGGLILSALIALTKSKTYSWTIMALGFRKCGNWFLSPPLAQLKCIIIMNKK